MYPVAISRTINYQKKKGKKNLNDFLLLSGFYDGMSNFTMSVHCLLNSKIDKCLTNKINIAIYSRKVHLTADNAEKLYSIYFIANKYLSIVSCVLLISYFVDIFAMLC